MQNLVTALKILKTMQKCFVPLFVTPNTVEEPNIKKVENPKFPFQMERPVHFFYSFQYAVQRQDEADFKAWLTIFHPSQL